MKFLIILLILGVSLGEEKSSGKHWFEISKNNYYRTEVCIDSDGKILGKVELSFPIIEPGIWYASLGESGKLGTYTTKVFAKRRVEKALSGCPGYTPITEK